jgi:O-antigen/teichoic acid export membrane protein
VITQLRQKKAGLFKLIQSQGFKKYFTNTSWLLIDNTATLAIGLFVSIFIARHLGPADFGLFNFAKSLAKFFTIFCALGLERIVIRNLVLDQENHANILGTTLGLKIGMSVLSTFLFAIVGYFVLDEAAYWLTFFLILVPLFEAFAVIRFYFASRVEARFISRMVLVKIIISSAVKLLLVYFQMPVIYFAIEVLVEAVLAMLGYLWVYKQRGKIKLLQWKFKHAYGKKLLTDSWPLLVSSFVIYIYTETDIIILRYMLGNEAVGHYSIAVRMTTIWYLVGTVICNSLFPAILNAKTNDEVVYKKRLADLLRLLIIIAVSIALFITLSGKWIIALLFGQQFLPAIAPLMILTWSLVFVYLGVAGTQWFIAENLQRYMMIRSVSGAIVNVILNILLIPILGIIGSAIATLIAQMMASFVGNYFTQQTRPLFIMQARALLFLKA